MLESRFGPGASIMSLRAELEDEGFAVFEETTMLSMQGATVTRDGKIFETWQVDEYLDAYCDNSSCSYLTAERKDYYFGWLLTRRYFVYAMQENGQIVAIGTESSPWRWFDFK